MVENTVVLRPPQTGCTCVFGRVMGGFVERWLGIRACFRHPWVAFVGRMQYAPTRVTCRTLKYGHVFRTGYMFRLGIRPCFSNRVYILVGDTDMFSPPMGGVCRAYAIRPYTCYMLYIEIRTCFSNGEYVLVRDTEMFFEPDIRYPSKYERVFQTGYTSSIQI